VGVLDVAVANTGDATARKLLKAVEEFHTYIENHQGFILMVSRITGRTTPSLPRNHSPLIYIDAG